uniref:Uncharacterized protein n=1 Tax=viral metagenome TaxID=1070528 RepID=A0A6M3L676_9ZZZZ
MSKQPGNVMPGVIPLYGNFYLQVGQAAFTNSATDVAIQTPLTELKFGFASHADTANLRVATDASVHLAVSSDISSTATSVARGGAAASVGTDMTDSGFHYLFFGTIDDTN